MLNFLKFLRSVSNAARGFNYAFKEQNFRIQLFASFFVVFLALFFNLKTLEIVSLIIVISLVIILEVVNSAFERIVDVLEPRVHPNAKTIKDMMAFAVLSASIAAVFVGVIIFLPYIYYKFYE